MEFGFRARLPYIPGVLGAGPKDQSRFSGDRLLNSITLKRRQWPSVPGIAQLFHRLQDEVGAGSILQKIGLFRIRIAPAILADAMNDGQERSALLRLHSLAYNRWTGGGAWESNVGRIFQRPVGNFTIYIAKTAFARRANDR